jgi:two-component sensor histidine kinase
MACDVIGKSLEMLFPAAQVDRSMGLIRKTLDGERWETVEIPILDVKGSTRIVLWNSVTLYAQDGKTPVGTIAQGQDITERRRAQNELEAAFIKLDALWNVSSLADADTKTICDRILFTLTRMTRSDYGFYGFINEDESVMTIHSWSGEAMKDCSMVVKPVDFPIKEAGVWGEAVRQRMPLILNDYAATHPAKKGLPTGHVRLTRLMVVPFFCNGRITAVAAAANRETPYEQVDIQQVTAFLNGVQAITTAKRAEEGLKNSLREKESMLKEIHHRVKNNLQIIISLLRLQSAQIDHPIAKAVLVDMQNRVRSMALIHEHIYSSKNLAQIDLASYLKSLCHQLFRSLVARPNAIQLHLDMVPVHLEIDQSIPCGLIVNELISNAFKHAFPDGRTGEVRVELQPLEGGKQLRLRVADNGVGLPVDFDIKRLSSLGLQLVSDLTRQLKGKLEIGSGPGASFDVVFTPSDGVYSPPKPGDTDTKEGK